MRSCTSQSANNSPLWSSCLTGQMRLLWDSPRSQNMKGDSVNVAPSTPEARSPRWAGKSSCICAHEMIMYFIVELVKVPIWCDFYMLDMLKLMHCPSSFFPEVSAATVLCQGGANAIGAADQHSMLGMVWKQSPGRCWFAFDFYHGLTVLNNVSDKIFLPQASHSHHLPLFDMPLGKSSSIFLRSIII